MEVEYFHRKPILREVSENGGMKSDVLGKFTFVVVMRIEGRGSLIVEVGV